MASKRHLRRKQCTRKIGYSTSKEAGVIIGKLYRKDGIGGTMNVYKCQFCKKYHIGHRRRRYQEI